MDLRSDSPATPGTPIEPSWRVSPALTWGKASAAVVFTLVAVYYLDEPEKAFVAVLGAAVAGIYGVRDLVAPVRLAADADGVTVISGFAGRRRLPWSRIERVRVDHRARLGMRSELLEIDAGDSLHLLSTYDLNADCADVAETLLRLRAGGG